MGKIHVLPVRQSALNSMGNQSQQNYSFMSGEDNNEAIKRLREQRYKEYQNKLIVMAEEL